MLEQMKEVCYNCRVYTIIFFYTTTIVPSIVTGLQGAYPYVVWNAPNQPNGVITGYRLTFTQNGVTETVDTDNDQTYYVIESNTWTSGSIVVRVSC